MKSLTAFPLLLAGTMLLGDAARADDTITYNYAELSYVRGEADFGETLGDAAGNGGRFEFSFEPINRFYVVGNYERVDLGDITVLDPVSLQPVTFGPFELDEYGAGLGWHTKTPSRTQDFGTYTRDRWSFFVDARYLSFDTGFGTDSRSDGYRARLGARGVNATKWEFMGAVGYRDLESADGEVTVEARLLYEIISNLDFQFGVDWFQDYTRGFLGFRYNFRARGD